MKVMAIGTVIWRSSSPPARPQRQAAPREREALFPRHCTMGTLYARPTSIRFAGRRSSRSARTATSSTIRSGIAATVYVDVGCWCFPRGQS